MDERFTAIEPETFGLEVLPFRPITDGAVSDPSAYQWDIFPMQDRDLGEPESFSPVSSDNLQPGLFEKI